MEKASLAEELDHLKNHIKYPATRAQVVQACNMMSDLHTGDGAWVSKNLPEGTYKAPSDVLNALLARV
jgi:hypothetical protein